MEEVCKEEIQNHLKILIKRRWEEALINIEKSQGEER